MLCLTFQIGPHRLALDVRRVREVVPRVELRPQPGGPPWLAGVLVYRGLAVPVVDLHALLGAGPCPQALSSRIVLVPLGDGLAGLLASHVADLRELEPTAGLPSLGGPDLGPAVVDAGGLLHLIDVERLLPGPVRALVPGGAP